MTTFRPSLAQRVRSGVTWNILSALSCTALQFGRSVAIARILAPDDVGLFAMALTVLGASTVLTNLGLDLSVLVGKFTDGERLATYLNTVWTAELIRRGILALLLLAFAYPAVIFYGDERLLPVILVVAFIPVIQGFSNAGLSLSRKNLDYKTIFLFELAGTAFSLGATVLLAWKYRSVWALVVSLLLTSTFTTLFSYWLHPYRPRFALDRDALRSAFGFGKHLFVLGLLSYITATADNILIGSAVGAVALGTYAFAYSLANLPGGIVGGALGSVTITAYAELNAISRERMEQGFMRVFRVGSVLLMLSAALLAVLADRVVLLLYGPKWSGIGPLLQVLAFLGFFRGLLQILFPFLMNATGLGQQTKAKACEAALFLALLVPLTIGIGSIGAAWAGALTYFVTVVNRLRSVRSFAPGVYRSIARVFVFVLLAGLAGTLLGNSATGAVHGFSAGVAVGSATVCAVAGMIMSLALPELRRDGLRALSVLRAWAR